MFVFGSDVKDVSVGVAIDEPSGDNQMAHSQIVVVIPVSNVFRMDVVFLCLIGFFVVALVSWAPLSCF